MSIGVNRGAKIGVRQHVLSREMMIDIACCMALS